MPDKVIQSTTAFLLRWWPVLIAFVALLTMAVEVRFQVRQLVADKSVNEAQWGVIEATADEVVRLIEWQKYINQVVTVEGMQEWGRVKDEVPRLRISAEANRRELDRRSELINNFRSDIRGIKTRLRDLERGPR